MVCLVNGREVLGFESLFYYYILQSYERLQTSVYVRDVAKGSIVLIVENQFFYMGVFFVHFRLLKQAI